MCEFLEGGTVGTVLFPDLLLNVLSLVDICKLPLELFPSEISVAILFERPAPLTSLIFMIGMNLLLRVVLLCGSCVSRNAE